MVNYLSVIIRHNTVMQFILAKIQFFHFLRMMKGLKLYKNMKKKRTDCGRNYLFHPLAGRHRLSGVFGSTFILLLTTKLARLASVFTHDTYYSLRLTTPTNGCTVFHSSLTWWAKRGPLSIKAYLKRFLSKKRFYTEGSSFQNVQTVYARRRRVK
jgi:hypothetical protein